MGTRERKQREFEQREQLFLDTARRLIREDGLLTLQMARLARECDYATGTLYQHFSSKEDLLVALATARIREHAGHFRRAADWPAASRERMFALAVVDVEFSRRHPTYSRLLQYVFTEVVWENASPERRECLIATMNPTIEAVRSIVAEAVAAGDVVIEPVTIDELMLGPWAVCHGMQSLLQTRGMLDSLTINEPDRMIFHHAQVLLNGLNWRPLFDVADRAALIELIERVRTEVIPAPGQDGESAAAANATTNPVKTSKS